jgi:rhodanese-related sulfurtransferase
MRIGMISLLGCLTCLSSVEVLAVEHTKDSLATVQANLDGEKALLLDVREPKEWKAGHLQEAQSLPLSELKEQVSNPDFAAKLAKVLPKEKIVYCHCAGGVRVLPAADLLKMLGYDVRPLKPGYRALLQAGFAPAADSGP